MPCLSLHVLLPSCVSRRSPAYLNEPGGLTPIMCRSPKVNSVFNRSRAFLCAIWLITCFICASGAEF